jgi:CheY-like chemotaxis protein
MSGMSGLELVPKAKAVRPDVPIIMITAYGDPETKRQAFENGAEALLTKPIDSRRCAVRSTAAPRAPHSRSKFPEFVALHESLDGTKRQLLRCNDMSGVECTPEVTGTRPKCRF